MVAGFKTSLEIQHTGRQATDHQKQRDIIRRTPLAYQQRKEEGLVLGWLVGSAPTEWDNQHVFCFLNEAPLQYLNQLYLLQDFTERR